MLGLGLGLRLVLGLGLGLVLGLVFVVARYFSIIDAFVLVIVREWYDE